MTRIPWCKSCKLALIQSTVTLSGNMRALSHGALKAGWNCFCSPPHQATLELDWHSDRPVPTVFNLALSFRKSLNCQNLLDRECWQKIRISVEEDGGQQAVSALWTPTLASQSVTTTPPSKASTRARLSRFFSSSHLNQPPRSSTPPPPGKSSSPYQLALFG